MNDFKFAKVVIQEGKAIVTMDRPPLNILNIAMMRELIEIFELLAADTTLRAVIINSYGKAFSSGVDVSEHTEEKVEDMMHIFAALFKALFAIKAVTIAAVNGPALGGGCELALGCDLVVASEKAKFAQPEIKVGVFAPMAAVLMPRLIRRNNALEWLLSGDTYSAEESRQIGLINKVFPSSNFDAAVDEYVAKFTDNSAAVIGLTKNTLDIALHLEIIEATNHADRCYLDELMKTNDAFEGLNAFLEKRKPNWRHC